MSNSRMIQAACPYCGKQFEFEVYDTVTADTDPDLRERCISGDLFRASCPHCRQEFMFQYPLIYISERDRFVLWLSAKEPDESLK